jgi:hypothetical protein
MSTNDHSFISTIVNSNSTFWSTVISAIEYPNPATYELTDDAAFTTTQRYTNLSTNNSAI